MFQTKILFKYYHYLKRYYSTRLNSCTKRNLWVIFTKILYNNPTDVRQEKLWVDYMIDKNMIDK